MCEAEAGYARQYLARHTKSWQVPGMHIAAVKGSRGARSDRLYVSRYLLCRCFLVRHMTNSLRWFALAVASAAAAAQAEQVPSWAIDLQQRVSLLEKEKADLQHVVAAVLSAWHADVVKEREMEAKSCLVETPGSPRQT